VESEHTAKTLQIALGSYDRKEILQAVSEQYDVSVSAVDSGIRRMIDQLEAKPSAKWLRFKDESGFADEKPTTGKLIYTVKNYLQRQKDD